MRVKPGRGNRKAIQKIESIGTDTKEGIRRAFYLIGKDLASTAKQSIVKGPKTGRLYRIKGRKNRHRASAPGEPPANLSGDLQKSVDFKVHGSDELEFGAGDSLVDYAKYMERGTPTIEERVFLYTAIESNQRNMERHFESGISVAMKLR